MNRREFIAAAAFSVKAPPLPVATTVIVEAGWFDRRDVVVSFPLPAGVDEKSTIVSDDSGKQHPCKSTAIARVLFYLI